jgi:hypothetical protein
MPLLAPTPQPTLCTFADVMLGVVPASVADSAPPGEQLEQRLTASAVEAAAQSSPGLGATSCACVCAYARIGVG